MIVASMGSSFTIFNKNLTYGRVIDCLKYDNWKAANIEESERCRLRKNILVNYDDVYGCRSYLSS